MQQNKKRKIKRRKSDNMKINLYDFDKTIYDGDSSMDFIMYCMYYYPKLYFRIPKIIFAAIKYKLKIIEKTQMKEVIFGFLKYIPDVDKMVKNFWDSHEAYIKDFYLEKDHKDDVIISASPEFLLEPITKKLKVKKMIASVVDKKTGKFTGKNCHGEEKVRRLNEVYKKYEVMESYSDSKVDIPILKLAKKAYYVKGEKLIETKF